MIDAVAAVTDRRWRCGENSTLWGTFLQHFLSQGGARHANELLSVDVEIVFNNANVSKVSLKFCNLKIVVLVNFDSLTQLLGL